MNLPNRNKRQRELARLDIRKEKEAKRDERKKRKLESPEKGADGVDPDIAHIIPGPQPIPEE
jgi:hypothetical protein